MTKRYLRPALIILIIIKSQILLAQSIEESLKLANEVFDQNKYSSAINLYERIIFFDSTNQYSPYIFENLAVAYQKQNEFHKAIYYFDLAFYAAENSGLNTNQLLINKAICSIRVKDFESAYTEALYINTGLKDSIIAGKQQTILLAIGSYHLEKYESSFNNFMVLCPDDSCRIELLDFFKELERINKKSPRKARILSMIFPGLGQYYIGEWKKGINSTLLVGGIASLLIVNSINTGFLNSFLNLMPWYQRYFMGGYTKVELMAERKLELKRIELLDKILLTIQVKYNVNI